MMEEMEDLRKKASYMHILMLLSKLINIYLHINQPTFEMAGEATRRHKQTTQDQGFSL